MQFTGYDSLKYQPISVSSSFGSKNSVADHFGPAPTMGYWSMTLKVLIVVHPNISQLLGSKISKVWYDIVSFFVDVLL